MNEFLDFSSHALRYLKFFSLKSHTVINWYPLETSVLGRQKMVVVVKLLSAA